MHHCKWFLHWHARRQQALSPASYGRAQCADYNTVRAEKQARPKAALDCYNYKVNLLKSLNREVVTSAALFTRLMPRCTQEGVNQARGYTHCLEPASSSSRSFPVLLGTGTRLHHATAALTEMKAGC